MTTTPDPNAQYMNMQVFMSIDMQVPKSEFDNKNDGEWLLGESKRLKTIVDHINSVPYVYSVDLDEALEIDTDIPQDDGTFYPSGESP